MITRSSSAAGLPRLRPLRRARRSRSVKRGAFVPSMGASVPRRSDIVVTLVLTHGMPVRFGRMAISVTRSSLAADLGRLGVRPGGVLMVHTRMSALGWVVGAAETVVRALLDALGPDGTLVAYASWEEHVYHAEDRPPAHRAAYATEPPVFDPATGEVDRDYGRIPERIRTSPGAERSFHPEGERRRGRAPRAGARRDHPPDDGYGAASPFARLVEAGGQVLLLGAALDTLTILHHAEASARVPRKRRVTFRVLVDEGGLVTRARLHRHRHLARRLPVRDARPRRRRVRGRRTGGARGRVRRQRAHRRCGEPPL